MKIQNFGIILSLFSYLYAVGSAPVLNTPNQLSNVVSTNEISNISPVADLQKRAQKPYITTLHGKKVKCTKTKNGRYVKCKEIRKRNLKSTLIHKRSLGKSKSYITTLHGKKVKCTKNEKTKITKCKNIRKRSLGQSKSYITTLHGKKVKCTKNEKSKVIKCKDIRRRSLNKRENIFSSFRNKKVNTPKFLKDISIHLNNN